MPQTTEAHRERWPGSDREASDFLIEKGWSVGNHWCWHFPTAGYEPSDREWDAFEYLIMEWDWGGVEGELTDLQKASWDRFVKWWKEQEAAYDP